MTASFLTVEVRFHPNYVCHFCGTEAWGDAIHDTFQGLSLEEVQRRISGIRAPSHAMPVGWSSNLYGFKCPACEDKRPEEVVTSHEQTD